MATQSPDNTATTSFDLVLPPDAELLRVVRLVASGLASLTPLGLDAVEAVRVAADELVATLIQASDGTRVTVTFELTADAVVISGHTQAASEAAFELDPLTDQILSSVSDRHDWHADGATVRGRIEQLLPTA
jgi:malonyl CoA-acyl carrier protein transacylase